MTISIELIDEMRKRTNCSYEEAKTLLEKHNGSIIDAIVEFEKTQGGCKHHFEHRSFGKRMKALFKKGMETRFVIKNKEENIVNLSINFMILAALVSIHIVIIGIVGALFMGYSFKITKQKGSDIDVDKVINNVADKAKSAFNSVTEEKKEEKKDQGFNEVTVE